MNAFLILLLCSLTCCFASPTCSDEEMRKCGTSYPEVVDTVEKLKNYCEIMSCWIGVYERCGLNQNDEGHIAYLTYKRAYGVTCDMSNPMRLKLVRNLQCLSDIAKSDEAKRCRLERKLSNHQEYCRNVIKSLECLYDLVFQRCGRDAKDAFTVAYPNAELFGCP